MAVVEEVLKSPLCLYAVCCCQSHHPFIHALHTDNHITVMFVAVCICADIMAPLLPSVVSVSTSNSNV